MMGGQSCEALYGYYISIVAKPGGGGGGLNGGGMEVVGGVSGVLAIVACVAKLAKKLNEVKDSYDTVALNIQLAAIQLATIRDALEAIAEWRLSAQSETQASKNLDATLAEALKGCVVLITVIDSKLGEAGYAPGVKRKIRHLWLEDVLKGYMSNLDGQVRALQLLLTSFQCRTVTEQIQRLQRAEAQSVFEQVRADTASLTVGNKDLEDVASVLSFDPSVNFEMDEILLKHPAYIAAYGDWRPPLPKRPSTVAPTSTASSPTKAHAQIPTAQQESPSNQLASGMKIKEKLQEPAAHEPTPQKTTSISQKPDVKTIEPLTRKDPPILTSPKSLATAEGVRNIDGRKADDPSLVSAVEAFNLELQSAFDNASLTEEKLASMRKTEELSHREESRPNNTLSVEDQEPDVQIARAQSDEEASDFDEMITLLPLASHFNISRKAKDTSRPSRPLSADSRNQETRRNRIKHSQSISSSRSVDPPAVAIPHIVPQAQGPEENDPPAAMENSHILPDESAAHQSRRPSVSEPLLMINENIQTNITSPIRRDTERRLSTESDLYTSSIAGNEWEITQPLKEPLSTDSELYKSSVAEEYQAHPTGPEAKVQREKITNQANVKPFPTTGVVANATENGFPLQSDDAANTKNVNGFKPASSDSKYNTPPATYITSPMLPQSQSSERITTSSGNDEVRTLVTRGVTAENRIGSTPIKKPTSTNSLRRSELVNSDYVKYSDAEQHGVKIILTPESGDEPKNDAIPDFAAPPSRPPPPVPPISSNSSLSLLSTNSSDRGRRRSDDTSQPGYMMAGAYTTSLIERDGSINGTLSTASSSDRSDQTLSSHMTTTTGTNTTFSHPPDTLRGQAQNDLHKLQLDLSAAKSRGDKSAQKASLQRSMDIIQKTYLRSSATKRAESEITASSPPKSKGNRMSLMPKKSMSLLSVVSRKSRQAELHEAARTGDIDTLRSLLEEKVPVNARGDRIKTPQMEAAVRGHLHCLETLKEFGADEFAVDGQGRTVLHMAVMSNQPKAVSWLIQAYQPSAPDMPGRKSSKIAWATEAITGSRSTKVLREASDGEGSRPLHIATRLALSEMVRLLLDSGSDIDAKDNWGRTSLTSAAILNRLDMVELLLDRGADIAAKDVDGKTALHWAAKNNHPGVVRALLSTGNARFADNEHWAEDWFDKNGDLPVHVAAREGHVEPVKLLKGDGQLSEPQTKYGETLIHITTLTNQLPVAKELMGHNVNVNTWAKPQSYHLRLWPGNESKYSAKALPLPYNITALHYACTLGYYEMTELLLENGAWVNATSDDDQLGKTPLMMAVESGSTNLVCLLLARGAKANAAVPATLMTALHMACKRGDLETTRELVRYGAKTASRTKDLRTPEELAHRLSDSKKRLPLEAYFAELTRLRYARLDAQRADSRRTAAEPSLPPQPSPGFQPHGQSQPSRGAARYAEEFVDGGNDTFQDAPPAYTPGPRAPQHLASRQGVYRPQYG
ncbi:MAG: hypothetical protein Q9211_005850 [Gyalolechia sp. 1 TL-2023]